MEWLLGLVGGALGGAGGGKAVKDNPLGIGANAALGAVGGLGTAGIIQMIAGAAETFNIAAVAGNLVGGGVGGAVISAVVGFIVKAVSKK